MRHCGRLIAARAAVVVALSLVVGCTSGGVASQPPSGSATPAGSSGLDSSLPADLPTVTWSGGTSFGSADHWAMKLYVELADRVAERTEGKFKINMTLLGELGIESSEFLPALNANRMQLAEIFSGASSGRIPHFGVFGLPFLISGPGDAAKVGDAVHDLSVQEFDKFGVTPIVEYVFPGVHLWSAKKLDDVTNWGGLKVRTYDEISTSVANALGGDGIVMNGNEAYEGMQRGVVEGGLTSTGSAISLSWHEVAPHGYVLNTSFPYVYIGISTEAFNALPEQYKTILMEEAEKIEVRFVEEFEAADAGANDEWVSLGGDLYEPTDAEKATIQTKVKPIWADWATKTGAQAAEALEAATGALGQ